MSGLLQNKFLDGLMTTVQNPDSQGITNFLSGLNFGGVGEIGGNTGITGGLTGLGAFFGPVGASLGFVTSIIPNLDGFLKSGFDFSCLGGQAFTKPELDQRLEMLKTEVSKMSSDNIQSVQNLLNWCSYQTGWASKAISQFSSGCSKSLMQKFKDAVDQVITQIKSSYPNSEKAINADSHMGSFSIQEYTLNGGATGENPLIGITPEKFETEIKPQIEKYALSNNLNVGDALNTAYQKIFGTVYNGGINGGISGGINTNGEWEVSGGLGNAKQDNTMMYLLIGGGVLLAWKFLKKIIIQ